jgi:hypothetical protein
MELPSLLRAQHYIGIEEHCVTQGWNIGMSSPGSREKIQLLQRSRDLRAQGYSEVFLRLKSRRTNQCAERIAFRTFFSFRHTPAQIRVQNAWIVSLCQPGAPFVAHPP